MSTNFNAYFNALGVKVTFSLAIGSNACVNFFLAWEKSVLNSTLFCCKRGFLSNFSLKRGKHLVDYVIVSYLDAWQSYFAHTYCQIHFTLFCSKFTFVEVYALFWVKKFCLKPCLCKNIVFFSPCLQLTNPLMQTAL